jgi:hypothetical protein
MINCEFLNQVDSMKIITDTKYRYRLIVIIISLMLFFTHCVSPFDPEIEGEDRVLLVVDGSLIKGRETQIIIISKTSPISQPEYLPVENCNVKIMDNTGNEFIFNEESPGKYVANIDDAWLVYDKQYKLIFTTSSGDDYESYYQWLLETDPVDSLYGIYENHYSPVTGKESNGGMQFYVDLGAPEDASRYYRWVLEETFEIHAENEIWGVYDGLSIKLFQPSDSLFRCWETKDVTGLYAASTVNLSENRIKKIPLHFVQGNSPKLNFKYCATVKQYALNADAYDYWYQKERELNESGNIYTIQPSQPISNIHNISNTDEKVMGFFWVASYAVKRVFVHIPSGPWVYGTCEYVGTYCESNDFNEISARIYSALSKFADILPDPPIYIRLEQNTNYSIVITPQCVDCRILGGEARKPDFWE